MPIKVDLGTELNLAGTIAQMAHFDYFSPMDLLEADFWVRVISWLTRCCFSKSRTQSALVS